MAKKYIISTALRTLMTNPLSPQQQAQKDELISTIESGVDFSTALLNRYKNNAALKKEKKEPEVIKEPENLLCQAIEEDDIALIQQLITQPLYQNQNNKSPSPGRTYLEFCSTKAFNLIYSAGLYHKEDLQKSILDNPLSYGLDSLRFLVSEGYELSLLKMLKDTEDMELPELAPEPHEKYIDFFKEMAQNNIEQINTDFLLELDDQLNEMAQDWSFYFNIFVAYAMIVSSTLTLRPESHYQELGEALGNKILYALSLNRVYDQVSGNEQEEIETEMAHYKNKYFIMPSGINNPLTLESLEAMIKELDVKVGQYHLQNNFMQHIEKSHIMIPDKKDYTFKL